MARFIVMRNLTVSGVQYERGQIIENETKLEGLIRAGFVRPIETATRENRETAQSPRGLLGRFGKCK